MEEVRTMKITKRLVEARCIECNRVSLVPKDLTWPVGNGVYHMCKECEVKGKRYYTAVYGPAGKDYPLTTVEAKDKGEAKRKIEAQLNHPENPSPEWRRWNEDGQRMNIRAFG